MTDLKEIQRQIAELSRGLGVLAGDQKAVLFGEFATQYVAQKLKRPLRKATLESFRIQAQNHLIPAFGHLPIDQVNNLAWLSWVDEKRKYAEAASHGAGRVTRFFNARKYLTEILLAAKKEGHISRQPEFDCVDERRNVGRVLEESETLAILFHSQRPFRFVFYAFWKTGCRPREILQWEWSMIKWKESGLAWVDVPARISKTCVSRPVPLNRELSQHLRRRFERGNGSRFVFPHPKDKNRPLLNYHPAWKLAVSRAGVEKCVPYDFRRTFITLCAASNCQMPYVAKILGTSMKMIEGTYMKDQVGVMEAIVNLRKAA